MRQSWASRDANPKDFLLPKSAQRGPRSFHFQKNSKLWIFSAPKDEPRCEKWKKLILRSDNELTSKSCAREFHFEADFIVRNYVHAISDETVTITRGNFDIGGLVHPSKTVVNALHQLEAAVTEYFTSGTLHRDSILDTSEIIKETGINCFGCTEHNYALTTNVVKFYLLYTLHFYIKEYNKRGNNG